MKTELRKIINEIELLETKITELRKKRDEIKKAPQKQKMKVFWDAIKVKEDKTEVAMQMIAQGDSVVKASQHVGLTASYVNQAIYKVWRKRYRKHHEANEERIINMGLITALRYSPPIFTIKTK